MYAGDFEMSRAKRLNNKRSLKGHKLGRLRRNHGAQFHARIIPYALYVLMVGYVMPGSVLASTESVAASSTIQWLQWGTNAFDRARAEDKLILLDLTARWCHACHVMDATTYSDPQVVALLNAKFIPVRVDTDQRPDITVRYKHGGWPTTSILLPSGEIVFQTNFLTAENIIEVLRVSDEVYREDKQGMVERAANVWAQVEAAKREHTLPHDPIRPAMLGQLLDAMKQQYDQVNGGFGDAPKFFEPEAITLAFARHFWDPNSGYRQMALFTLDQQLQLYDPVWGGFFRYAEESDWSKPHYEKMLYIQASNLLNYLEAYQSTGLPIYRGVVEGTMRYVTRFLSDQERGGFYASQDADVRHVDGAGTTVLGSEFFVLNESQRLGIGVPAVDRTMLTDWNGMMAKAFLRVAQVLGSDQARKFALTTLQRLYDERYQPGRGLAHFLHEGRSQQFGLLADQVFFADALIEAFVTTGVLLYLEQAEAVIADCVHLLGDERGGGYFDRVPASSSLGLLKFPHKDLRINAALSMVFSDLFYLTRNPWYRDKARTLLQFIAGAAPLPVTQTGRALSRFLYDPVSIVVVGDKSTREAQHLFRHSLAMYVPGKMVRFLDPRVDVLSIGGVTFPRVTGPLAYVCTDRLCSSPVRRADELMDQFKEVFAAVMESRTGFPTMENAASSPAR